MSAGRPPRTNWTRSPSEATSVGSIGDHVRYVPDFTRLYTERIRELALSLSREELREEIVQAKEDVQTIQSEYAVESRGELEASLNDEDVSAAEARDRQQSLREWEEVADELQLIEHALSLYDDLRRGSVRRARRRVPRDEAA